MARSFGSRALRAACSSAMRVAERLPPSGRSSDTRRWRPRSAVPTGLVEVELQPGRRSGCPARRSRRRARASSKPSRTRRRRAPHRPPAAGQVLQPADEGGPPRLTTSLASTRRDDLAAQPVAADLAPHRSAPSWRGNRRSRSRSKCGSSGRLLATMSVEQHDLGIGEQHAEFGPRQRLAARRRARRAPRRRAASRPRG